MPPEAELPDEKADDPDPEPHVEQLEHVEQVPELGEVPIIALVFEGRPPEVPELSAEMPEFDEESVIPSRRGRPEAIVEAGK